MNPAGNLTPDLPSPLFRILCLPLFFVDSCIRPISACNCSSSQSRLGRRRSPSLVFATVVSDWTAAMRERLSLLHSSLLSGSADPQKKRRSLVKFAVIVHSCLFTEHDF